METPALHHHWFKGTFDPNCQRCRELALAPDFFKVCKWLSTAMDTNSAIWCAIREQPGASEWGKNLEDVIFKAEPL